MSTYIRACLLACLPACLPITEHAYPACLPSMSTYIRACLPSYSPACLPTIACLPVIAACLPATSCTQGHVTGMLLACYWHATGRKSCCDVSGTEAALARALLVAKVAAAMADRSPEAVAHDLPEAVQLAELLLTCLSLGTTLCCTLHLWEHASDASHAIFFRTCWVLGPRLRESDAMQVVAQGSN